MSKKKLSKEEQLQVLVQELYAEYHREVRPLYPKVFIRVLPKELRYGEHIILPEAQQNKTLWEGVVLATYPSFWSNRYTFEDVQRATRVIETGNLLDDGKDVEVRSVWQECAVHPGDHIAFPHHAGIPDAVFDEKKYRIIREEDIAARFVYERTQPLPWVQEKMSELGNGLSMDGFVEELFKNWELVTKNIGSKTLSGV